MTSRRIRLTPTDVASVVADYQSGAKVDTICMAHRIGLSRLYRILDDEHVPRRKQVTALRTPEYVAQQIASAYQAGEPVRSIADRHGVSYSNVSNIGRRLYRARMHVRLHDDLVELVDRWFAGEQLTETEIDAITRVGVRTRRHGLATLDGLDPALRPAVVRRVIERLEPNR